MPSQFLIDTNVLLRLTSLKHPHHSVASKALRSLLGLRHELLFTLQNASEFWNVCTRSLELNGLGYSIAETEHHLALLEKSVTLLPDTNRVYEYWRMLILQNSIRGL